MIVRDCRCRIGAHPGALIIVLSKAAGWLAVTPWDHQIVAPARENGVMTGCPLDNSSQYPQLVHSWFTNIACSRQVPPRRLNRSAPDIVSAFSGTASPFEKHRSDTIKGGAILSPILPRGAISPAINQGVSHAEWPKNF